MTRPTCLKDAEIEDGLKRLEGWKLAKGMLSKNYVFPTFKAAMEFIRHVAEAAEAMDHHPDIHVYYNKVTLDLVTHSAGGITELDFQLAEKL